MAPENKDFSKFLEKSPSFSSYLSLRFSSHFFDVHHHLHHHSH